jgi:hypothetical protein
MDQVDHDVRRQLAFAGHAVDQVDLVVALVHQRCPGALVIGTQLRSAFSKTRATTRPASSTMLAVTNFVSALRAGGASAGALRRPRLRSGVRGTGARSRRNRRCHPFALRLRSLEWRAADLGWILAEALRYPRTGPLAASPLSLTDTCARAGVPGIATHWQLPVAPGPRCDPAPRHQTC